MKVGVRCITTSASGVSSAHTQSVTSPQSITGQRQACAHKHGPWSLQLSHHTVHSSSEPHMQWGYALGAVAAGLRWIGLLGRLAALGGRSGSGKRSGTRRPLARGRSARALSWRRRRSLRGRRPGLHASGRGSPRFRRRRRSRRRGSARPCGRLAGALL